MLDKNFKDISNSIKEMVLQTQFEIMADANSRLVKLYFKIGEILEENSNWGNKFIDNTAIELKLSED